MSIPDDGFGPIQIVKSRTPKIKNKTAVFGGKKIVLNREIINLLLKLKDVSEEINRMKEVMKGLKEEKGKWTYVIHPIVLEAFSNNERDLSMQFCIRCGECCGDCQHKIVSEKNDIKDDTGRRPTITCNIYYNEELGLQPVRPTICVEYGPLNRYIEIKLLEIMGKEEKKYKAIIDIVLDTPSCYHFVNGILEDMERRPNYYKRI